MSGTVGQARSLVTRVVVLQTACAVCVAAIFWLTAGGNAALAGLAGGMIAAIGSAVFGWRMFAPGIAGADVLRRALYAGEALKWFWYVLAVWLALARFKLAPLPLMVGIIVAQFGYWFGLIGTHRRG